MVVESRWLGGSIVSKEEFLECIEKRYRNRSFKDGERFVHAMLEMLRIGVLPEEMLETFEKHPELGVSIRDTKTIYRYVQDILDMYPRIKEGFYEALMERIEEGELPKNKTTFWKGRFLEDLVYEGLTEIFNELTDMDLISEEVIVVPTYRIRTRPGNHETSKRGKKSDADKIADILVIDWNSRTLIVIELKNFWEYYSGRYDTKEQARKLFMTLTNEGIGIIVSRMKDGRIPGKSIRKYNFDLVQVAWDVLCEDRKEACSGLVEDLKFFLSTFRKVYVWFHAGELVDKLEEKLDEFEKEVGIEILRVFVGRPLYYTRENKQFVDKVLRWMLYAVYNEKRRVRTIEIDSENVTVEYNDYIMDPDDVIRTYHIDELPSWIFKKG